jgi:orotidine-5'-phosphate decarboxylase
LKKKYLTEQIRKKGSFLCIGLDTDRSKLPHHLQNSPDAIFEFNKAVIEATHDLCVAYKLNSAFYEAEGLEGWEAMKKTAEIIPPEILKIVDAKRGDIANTGKKYAQAFFEKMNFDAITVAPYMGKDSVTPFLEYKDKWTILLALTSNQGSEDFQMLVSGKEHLYESVIKKSLAWTDHDNLMFVIGATHPERIKHIREIAPESFFLVPGVGAQGGDLEQISKNGLNKDVGLLINVSRDIIYASSESNFETAIRERAMLYRDKMKKLLL